MGEEDTDVVATLGARVASLRRARGMTQAELAERIGVDGQTVQRLERGRVSTSLSRLETLALALGVDMAQFFTDADAPVPREELTVRELAVLTAFRDVQEERKDLALRILRELIRP